MRLTWRRLSGAFCPPRIARRSSYVSRDSSLISSSAPRFFQEEPDTCQLFRQRQQRAATREVAPRQRGQPCQKKNLGQERAGGATARRVDTADPAYAILPTKTEIGSYFQSKGV